MKKRLCPTLIYQSESGSRVSKRDRRLDLCHTVYHYCKDGQLTPSIATVRCALANYAYRYFRRRLTQHLAQEWKAIVPSTGSREQWLAIAYESLNKLTDMRAKAHFIHNGARLMEACSQLPDADARSIFGFGLID
jgi:hypothetical protein